MDGLYLSKEISTSLCGSRGALMKSFDFHKEQQGGSPLPKPPQIVYPPIIEAGTYFLLSREKSGGGRELRHSRNES